MNDFIAVDTITQAHEMLGLEKPLHPLVSVVPHTKELEDQFKFLSASDYTVVLNLYTVMLKGGCTGSLRYGRNSYDFEEGTLIFTGPGQIIEAEEMDDSEPAEIEGWTLMFHPDLIRKSPLGQHIDDYSFFSYDVNEALHLSDQEKASIGEIIAKIQQEVAQNIDKHSQKLIVSNIELLLDYCTRYYDRQFYTRTNQSSDFVSKFERYLKDYFSSDQPFENGIPTVKSCGEYMGMSPNYLSDLLKKETGTNAQEHIHNALVNRAKTELLSSSNAVGQVAFSLGFEYSQHFSKLFKKKTGMTPKEYRSQN
ncbi:helix-turn-helix domain-containing protein [Parvicella tangerina]|uniref:HTH-type transcriptional activator RhaR n=1 Tax=Parvicella tangerina TaxID=2829795 RepID=A0A916JLX7_9FLAO|nr:response regulator transcription factor [Parvicella tangerina]CAG5081009.1 HTH-type transcriptional activator RhaR [Parvicella tangerina]